MKRLFVLSLLLLSVALSGCVATTSMFIKRPVEATNTFWAEPSIDVMLHIRGEFEGPVYENERGRQVGASDRRSANAETWQWIRHNGDEMDRIQITKLSIPTGFRWNQITFKGIQELNYGGKRVMYLHDKYENVADFYFFYTRGGTRYRIMYTTSNVDAQLKDVPLKFSKYTDIR